MKQQIKIRMYHVTSVGVGDYVYGSSSGGGTALFAAINIHTGKIAWRKRGFAQAVCVWADDHLIILDQDGQLALASPPPRTSPFTPNTNSSTALPGPSQPSSAPKCTSATNTKSSPSTWANAVSRKVHLIFRSTRIDVRPSFPSRDRQGAETRNR